jgi:predicted CXXCH cytochrome family protein
MRLWVGVATLILVATASGAWALSQSVESFPHADHEGLFPLCAGCHVGIETGVAEDAYPDPSTCTTCHDGEREARVEWSGPTPEASNLIYSHPDHDQILADAGESADCVTCHREADAEVRMAVAGARADTCLACHVPEAPRAPQHLANVGECIVCHTSVWDATELSMARLEAFPQPDDHDSPGFILEHGQFDAVDQATCATCHARESCERCHANAAAVPAIVALERDARVASLVGGTAAEYPVPVEHQASDWSWNHSVVGSEAGGEAIASCANCHTQPSCIACHTDRVNAQVAELPLGDPSGAPGVSFVDADRRVHRDDFALTHRAQAAAREESCLGCHVEETCISCHDGPGTPVFHEGGFLEVHASSAYRSGTDCASCHTTEVFCRECHQGVGLTSRSAINVAFHNRNPTWLLGHGAAARQGLEGCVTCHAQADCTQCHSAIGGWGISPHGPGFDPVRAAEANRGGCVICHRPGLP